MRLHAAQAHREAAQTQDPTQGEAITWAVRKFSWLRCCEASPNEESSVELAVIVVEPVTGFVKRPQGDASSALGSCVELDQILLEPGVDCARRANGEEQPESEGGARNRPGKKFTWRWWSKSVEHSLEPTVAWIDQAPGFGRRPQEGASSRPDGGALSTLEGHWKEWTLEDLESQHI